MAKKYKLSAVGELENAFKTRTPAPRDEGPREEVVAKIKPLLRDAKARGFTEKEIKNIVKEIVGLALKDDEVSGDKPRPRKVAEKPMPTVPAQNRGAALREPIGDDFI